MFVSTRLDATRSDAPPSKSTVVPREKTELSHLDGYPSENYAVPLPELELRRVRADALSLTLLFVTRSDSESCVTPTRIIATLTEREALFFILPFDLVDFFGNSRRRRHRRRAVSYDDASFIVRLVFIDSGPESPDEGSTNPGERASCIPPLPVPGTVATEMSTGHASSSHRRRGTVERGREFRSGDSARYSKSKRERKIGGIYDFEDRRSVHRRLRSGLSRVSSPEELNSFEWTNQAPYREPK